MTHHRTLRLRLGLTPAAEARLLGVNPRTVQRWDEGSRDVPPPVWRLLWLLEAEERGVAGGVRAALLLIAEA